MVVIYRSGGIIIIQFRNTYLILYYFGRVVFGTNHTLQASLQIVYIAQLLYTILFVNIIHS